MPALSLTRSLEITVPGDLVDKENRPPDSSDTTAAASRDSNASDLEKENLRVNYRIDEKEEEEDRDDRNIVWWDGEDDPANPQNWSPMQKWTHVAVVSAITFLVPLASSMFAPGAAEVMQEFNITDSILGSIVVSIYVLGLAFGPLVLAPISEVYGRWICYTCCNLLYLVFTIACAVSTNLPMLIIFRFLAGCMGACPLTVGAGTIADLFPVHQRGLAISLYSLGPVSGPAIGPVAGGFLSQAKGWRWIFWVLSMTSGALCIAQILMTRETYAIILLDRKASRLRKETGDMTLRSKLDRGITNAEILKRAIIRPTKMTLLSPINILLSVACAVIYGILYLLLTTFPMVFETAYGFSIGISGLTYIGLGVGNILGLLVFTLTSDRYVAQRAAKGKLKPEDRLPLLLLSGPVIAIGLFWYGWSAEAKLHWIMPIIGSGILGIGNMFFFMPVTGYLVDAFTMYAASALAANTVLRSIGGALLPLAGPSMYTALGFGWGNSVLGFLALAFSPGLVLIWRYGEYIRTKYPLNL